MNSTAANPLPRQRNLILGCLLVLAAAAWALLVWQSAMADEKMVGLTMGLAAPMFLTIWVAMMVAMMFPTAAPMILMFHQGQAGRRQQGQPFVSTWVFVAAYLAVWTVFGALAYVAATAGQLLVESQNVSMDNVARLGGGVIAVAGLYQLSPLKYACLSKCRTPLSFVLTSWRDGIAGALRMGLVHGGYCLGCCWLLFVILFPLGIMNVAAMAVITLLIFAEKSLPIGRGIGKVAALALIACGVVVLLVPGVLPSLMPRVPGI